MDYQKMLKEIMILSGWTQEQLAARLGVSFATVNSWLNGKSTPRGGAMKTIEKLYMAQDVTGEVQPVYVTIIRAKELAVGDCVLLEKEGGNEWDDEAIKVTRIEDDIYDSGASDGDEGEIDAEDDEMEIRIGACDYAPEMYVANSVPTVARGTYSAGRLYDKFDSKARAQVMFVLHGTAIARVVEWNGER